MCSGVQTITGEGFSPVRLQWRMRSSVHTSALGSLPTIRLNQQTRHNGLALDDITVGAISAIAPLALAGALHFYLLVARRP
ncbi:MULTISPECIES: hypothetical protein [unclassified Streptomyces]|uniref:hypothetical protein n=1 Tax=unclassified Streptomyces TaxID=2593676 RepID=UPI0036533619